MEGAAVELEHGETSKAPLPAPAGSGINRVLSVVDIVLRFIAIGGTAGSAIAMGTTNEALPFFTPFVQFRAEYSDLPSLTFFVVANSVVCAYLVLSLPVSVVHAFRPRARYSLAILVFFDAVMLALLMAGAAAAAAIVYLAHRGNAPANWFAICQQFSSFCERISRSLIGSFAAVILLLVLVFLSALALARRG